VRSTLLISVRSSETSFCFSKYSPYLFCERARRSAYLTYLALTSDNHRLFVSSFSLGVGGFSWKHNLYFFRTLILKLLVETLFHRVLVLVNLFQ
jgi:hypothetical protein